MRLQQEVSSPLFFFNDTATTEIYTLSLHDALPIFPSPTRSCAKPNQTAPDVRPYTSAADDSNFRERRQREDRRTPQDRKSTRLNSSHANISYAVFCLKKKKHYHSVSALS